MITIQCPKCGINQEMKDSMMNKDFSKPMRFDCDSCGTMKMFMLNDNNVYWKGTVLTEDLDDDVFIYKNDRVQTRYGQISKIAMSAMVGLGSVENRPIPKLFDAYKTDMIVVDDIYDSMRHFISNVKFDYHSEFGTSSILGTISKLINDDKNKFFEDEFSVKPLSNILSDNKQVKVKDRVKEKDLSSHTYKLILGE